MLFVVLLLADFLLIFGVVFSIFFPRWRIWPPPRKFSLQFWLSWIVSTIGMLGTPLLGVLDFNSLGGWNWIYFLLGCLAVAIGGFVGVWGVATLSEYQSLGLKGKVITDGPYRYTRNPQYLGFILLYAGIILMTFSFMALVTGAIIIATFVILPFSEEPWLLQEYGKPYEYYCKKVPRFIGVSSFKEKQLHQ
jgi:protein-S-isoprenylcysteine O-methyltransferase Ste14